MERITQVLRNSGLTVTSELSPRRLSEKESQALVLLVGQMAQRYPSQDLTDSMEGYLEDFEALALRYSLPRVKAALCELRIKPGQAFFPRPDEVSGEIEKAMEIEREKNERARQRSRAERERQEEIDEFWNHILPDRIERFGWSEEEALQRFPSFRGTKPGQSYAQKANVVHMPIRDGKTAAAGDRDDAA